MLILFYCIYYILYILRVNAFIESCVLVRSREKEKKEKKEKKVKESRSVDFEPGEGPTGGGGGAAEEEPFHAISALAFR